MNFKPSSSLRLQSLAIDLGGTSCDIAHFANDRIDKIQNFPTPENPADYLMILESKLQGLNLGDIAAIGVGAPGFWDDNCVLKQSLNLPQYVGFPIWSRLSSALNIPVLLKADVELAVMGEAVYGLHDQFESVLYINMGTGFGAGLYKNSEVFTTSYSPVLRLDFMVHPEFISSGNFPNREKSKQEKNLESIAALSSTLINLACIVSPQVISIGGGKTHEANWQSVIQPAVDKALRYLDQVLTYKIQIFKSRLENPVLYGAHELVKRSFA
jgi:predicted NBD/HSP70 family sugar kinase